MWTLGLTVEIKLRFRNGLVWTLGLTVEIKLRFQTFLQRSVATQSFRASFTSMVSFVLDNIFIFTFLLGCPLIPRGKLPVRNLRTKPVILNILGEGISTPVEKTVVGRTGLDSSISPQKGSLWC